MASWFRKSALESLPVAMSGVKLADRLLVIGASDPALAAALAAKVGLTGRACVVDKDVFASEFVIRAYREGLRVREIPVRVLEKRRPSINLTRRVPNVLKSLAKLTWAIRVKG